MASSDPAGFLTMVLPSSQVGALAGFLPDLNSTTVAGLFQIIDGIFEIYVAAGLAEASAGGTIATGGAAAPAGAAGAWLSVILAAHGMDKIYAGYRTISSGQYTRTVTSQALDSLTGSRETSETIETIGSMATGMKAIGTIATRRAISLEIQQAAKGIGAEAVRPLTEAQRNAVRKIQNIERDHLKPHDFTGTLRDMVGNPVPKPGGGFFDHVHEMNDTLRGLRNHVETLNNATDPVGVTAREWALNAIKVIEEFTMGAGI